MCTSLNKNLVKTKISHHINVKWMYAGECTHDYRFGYVRGFPFNDSGLLNSGLITGMTVKVTGDFISGWATYITSFPIPRSKQLHVPSSGTEENFCVATFQNKIFFVTNNFRKLFLPENETSEEKESRDKTPRNWCLKHSNKMGSDCKLWA